MPHPSIARAMLGAIVVALAVPPAPAPAAWLNTRISANGADANDCSNLPCRTVNRAYGETLPGGQISILDSGGFLKETFVIAKPISIYAVGVSANLFNGLVTSTGDYITVNAPANAVVYLDGLRLIGDGTFERAPNGIVFNSGAQLHLRNCWIQGFRGAAIRIKAPGSSEVIVSNCRLFDNGYGVFAEKNGGSGPLGVLVDNTTITANQHAGIRAKGGGTHVRINGSKIVRNTSYGLWPQQNARLISYGNNVITRNGTNGQPTHSASPK